MKQLQKYLKSIEEEILIRNMDLNEKDGYIKHCFIVLNNDKDYHQIVKTLKKIGVPPITSEEIREEESGLGEDEEILHGISRYSHNFSILKKSPQELVCCLDILFNADGFDKFSVFSPRYSFYTNFPLKIKELFGNYAGVYAVVNCKNQFGFYQTQNKSHFFENFYKYITLSDYWASGSDGPLFPHLLNQYKF